MSKKPHIKWNQEFADKVEHLAALGMTQEDVGKILGVSSDTIYKHYNDAFGKGKAVARAKVANKLFEKAMSGDSASIFFYLKTQAGWRETQHVDNTSSDGSMTPRPAVNVDLSNLTPQQIAKMAKAAFRGESD